MAKMTPVSSLADLSRRARDDERYRRLAIVAAENLGGDVGNDLRRALAWLETNAMETDEEGVVGEVNFCLDLVEP